MEFTKFRPNESSLQPVNKSHSEERREKIASCLLVGSLHAVTTCATVIMGSNVSKQRRKDTREGVKEVVEELPQNLQPAVSNKGSVTLAGYDPDKTPAENAEYHANRKPINEKIHNVLKNKYPQGSVTMGGVDPENIKKDTSDGM